MMTIPWTSTSIDSDRPDGAVVQVSRLELARVRDVPGFLLAALRIRRATLQASGAIGVSLRAAPFSRTFWTLSAWADQDSILGFVRSDAHRAVMQKYRDRMAGSHFHTWTELQSTDRRPTWDDAMQRHRSAETATP